MSSRRELLLALGLILPSAVVIAVVIVLPTLETLYLSLYDSTLGARDLGEFLGVGNYSDLLSRPAFWQAIGRTAYFTIVSVGLEMVLGIGIGLLINAREPGWSILRIGIIIPWAIPTNVVGTIWRWIYNADYGALNGLLLQVGLIDHYVPWLTQPWRAMNLVILADVWHTFPFVALIVQAALATMPGELFEAADIDGASGWQAFWRITLPLLRPALLLVVVVRTVEAFRVFDIIYIITRGGPADGTLSIAYQTYLETFSFLHIGTGSALSFVVSLILLGAALVYIRLLYSEDLAS